METLNSPILIIKAPCWNCDKEMLIAVAGTESGFLYGPEKFSKSEKDMAEANGVKLEMISSKTAEAIYLANICKDCGSFTGGFYLFAHYFAPAMSGEYKYTQISG